MSIQRFQGVIRMEIKDNGKGFEVNRPLVARRHERWGRLGMRERVEQVDDSLVVVPPPDQGATIRAQIPFRNGA